MDNPPRKTKQEAKVNAGRKGGKSLAQKYGNKYMQDIARRGGEAKARNHRKKAFRIDEASLGEEKGQTTYSAGAKARKPGKKTGQEKPPAN